MIKSLATGNELDRQSLYPPLRSGSGGLKETRLVPQATHRDPEAIQEPPAPSHLINIQEDTIISVLEISKVVGVLPWNQGWRVNICLLLYHNIGDQ